MAVEFLRSIRTDLGSKTDMSAVALLMVRDGVQRDRSQPLI